MGKFILGFIIGYVVSFIVLALLMGSNKDDESQEQNNQK